MKSRVYRLLWFAFGIVLNSFGIALITKAALGTSPISSVPLVLSDQYSLTFGQFTFIMNTLFILGQALLLRRDFHPVQLLQMLVNVVFSAGIDVSMGFLSWLQPAGNPLVEGVALLLGCAVLALGISIEVASDTLLVPGEGAVKAISQTLGIRFGTVKVAFDLSLVCFAACLSFLFSMPFDGLGLGTLVSALVVGRIVNVFNAKLPLVSYIQGLKGPIAPAGGIVA